MWYDSSQYSIFPVPPPPDCPGCYKPSKVNQEIVDFAVSELQGGDQGGKCSGGVLGVENFQSQVGLEVRAGFDWYRINKLRWWLGWTTSSSWPAGRWRGGARCARWWCSPCPGPTSERSSAVGQHQLLSRYSKRQQWRSGENIICVIQLNETVLYFRILRN